MGNCDSNVRASFSEINSLAATGSAGMCLIIIKEYNNNNNNDDDDDDDNNNTRSMSMVLTS